MANLERHSSCCGTIFRELADSQALQSAPGGLTPRAPLDPDQLGAADYPEKAAGIDVDDCIDVARILIHYITTAPPGANHGGQSIAGRTAQAYSEDSEEYEDCTTDCYDD